MTSPSPSPSTNMYRAATAVPVDGLSRLSSPSPTIITAVPAIGNGR